MQDITAEIQAEINSMMDEICEATSEIIVEEATEYYKERFEKKEWDGQPWQPAKRAKKSGSLLIQSSQLVNSIRPTVATKERVVIATVGGVVNQYARAHNEGFDGDVNIGSFTRTVKGKTQTVKAHTRHQRIPKRQFMGQTDELDQRIEARIANYIESIITNE